jgi:uncharacterized membrane protein SpoIIM required for sporulation
MNEQAFVDRREEDWKRLKALSDKADGKGIKKLSGDEVRELLKLYRRASTDLAIARTTSRNVALVDFLNDVVARVYGIFYRAPKMSVFRGIVSGLEIAAQTVRRRKAFVLTAAGIFFGAWVLMYSLISAVPETRSAIVSPVMDPMFKKWQSGQFEERSVSESVAMNAVYASNNPRVSIIAGSIGAATFGIGSVYLLFENGALIGALSHDMNDVGKLGFLLASIFPHGVTELSGIIISGSAGLLLGWALINPGRRSRGDALKAVGRDAVVLILTAVVLMFMAAPIEAYFSFNPIVPLPAKAAVAVFSFVAWMTFWSMYGKPSTEISGPSR